MAIAAALFSIFVIFLSLYEPYVNARRAFPLEWIFFLLWIGLGLLFWGLAGKIRQQMSEQERCKVILGTQERTEPQLS